MAFLGEPLLVWHAMDDPAAETRESTVEERAAHWIGWGPDLEERVADAKEQLGSKGQPFWSFKISPARGNTVASVSLLTYWYGRD